MKLTTLMTLAVALAMSGCHQPSANTAPAQMPTLAPFKITASVKELMEAIIDPSADGVWDSVGTIITQKGTDNRQPHTDAEWKQVRLHALALIEGTNLLMMDGRRLIPEGGKILDEGSEGVLSTAEAEQKFSAQHAVFVQFAGALNDVGHEMLQAIDARKPEAMVEAGEKMDEVCESCHTTFWYPNQATWKVTQGVTQPERK